MLIYRLLRVVLHVLYGMTVCATIFPWIGLEARNRHIRRWSRSLLAIFNVTVELAPDSAPPLEHAMIVANHVSWLDIFVVDALYPCRFVAKAEIRSWPLAGWLAEKAGTVFISRGSKRDLRNIFKGLVHSLQAGERVAFFPEGTTAPQGTLLPFHANLFEAAVDAKVMVQPLALSYSDAAGGHHPDVDFIGETTFAESVLAILRGPPVRARLRYLPAMDATGTHRRDLAQAAHEAVSAGLGIAPESGGVRAQR